MHLSTLAPFIVLLATAAVPPAQTKPFFDAPTLVVLGTGTAWAPTLSQDGLEIFFSSNRTGGSGGWDIWTAKRIGVDKPFGTPTNVTLLNSSSSDYETNLSSDGLELFFASTRQGGLGASNVMVSTRLVTVLPWGAPTMLPAPVNGGGKAIDDPQLTQDMLAMF